MSRRIVIIGGPRRGKSTLARKLRTEEAIPTFCGDPLSTVKDPEPDVTYLPEGLTWSEGSEYIARNWLTVEGPWVCEGVSMVRALRKALELEIPISDLEIIRLTEPVCDEKPGQARMAKAVETIWREVEAMIKGEKQADKLPEIISTSPSVGFEAW